MAEEKNKENIESKDIDAELEKEPDYKEEDLKESPKKEKKVKKDKKDIEIEQLKAEISNLKKLREQDLEDYRTARADLENTKKRIQNDSIEQRKYATQGLIEKLVQPIDMLDLVCKTDNVNPDVQNFLIGFRMISNQLMDLLKAEGLSEIECLNKKFDPNFMQALSKEKVDGVEPDMVIEVLQRGYKIKDKVLKPAMVKVSE
jgi:molecular chaperone GrpE